MSNKQKAVILNRDHHMFGVPFLQGVWLYAAVLVACFVASHMSPVVSASHLPLSFMSGIAVLSAGLVLAHTSDPVVLIQLRNVLSRQLLSLPDVQLEPGGNAAPALWKAPDGRCLRILKCVGTPLLQLTSLHEDLLGQALCEIAGMAHSGIQVVSLRQARSAGLTHYLIFEENPALDSLLFGDTNIGANTSLLIAQSLRNVGIQVKTVSRGEYRRVLFSLLSPGAFESGSLLPDENGLMSELLTLCTAGLRQESDHLFIDGQYARTFYLTALPQKPYLGWLYHFCQKPGAMMSVRINHCDQQQARRDCNNALLFSALCAAAAPTAIKREQFACAHAFLSGADAMFDAGVYVTLRGGSRQELDQRTALLLQAATIAGAKFESMTGAQLDGFISTLPVDCDQVKARWRLFSGATGMLWPFIG